MLNTNHYNALSLAQPTNFKSMLHSGKLLWGTGCRIPHEEAARIVASTPYHFCFIDAEHTPLNATLLVNLVRTIQYHSSGSMVPFVRIPGCSPELVNYALNAGAGGVVMPHIQNARQAEELVRLARFPPMGDRSFPPAALINKRQQRTPESQTVYDVWNDHAAVICQIEDLQGLDNIEEICGVPGEELVRLARFPPMGDRSFPPAALINKRQQRTPESQTVYDVWNDHAAVICQIEDLQGLDNIEEICGVPGVDGLFIGTGDLRMCMGLAVGSLDGDEPVFVSALQRIRDAAKANDLPIMGFGISPSTLERRIDMGWNAFIIHGDIDAICTSAVRSLDSYCDAADHYLSARRNKNGNGSSNGLVQNLGSTTREEGTVGSRNASQPVRPQ
ncbi:HpcH/HpaI aldolase/citrate lyase family protein [Metarhizium acridum CQMa 102]|uniref:HpcH/HpaI aldolase/citrate lyase family protein n=1 Tax=Metarhizium acridum (strain CQMa 102) TaxID=655827 RepID=E9E6A8_METAQ|nr:HpcH/HpaI aldolase/citrate lyase family protein [Metarhizium acridum CQMa 102]EFY88512.1 HpcH/HpaI aldolase/citrate lyase family protein [Metarhizium acridum CQMa 102]